MAHPNAPLTVLLDNAVIGTVNEIPEGRSLAYLIANKMPRKAMGQYHYTIIDKTGCAVLTNGNICI